MKVTIPCEEMYLRTIAEMVSKSNREVTDLKIDGVSIEIECSDLGARDLIKTILDKMFVNH